MTEAGKPGPTGDASPPQPAAPRPTETSQTTTLWSLVDLAVSAMPHLVPGMDAEAMRVCMSLSCSADLVFYDISATIREQSGSVPVINPLLVLSLFDEIEMRDLTRLCNRSRAAISMIVADLVDQGLATRRTSPEDRRVNIIKITEAGTAAFKDMFAMYNQREQYWANVLNKDEQAQFIHLLGKLVNSRIDDQDIRLRR